MKLKVEDILKPGAVMVTEKLDFNDPRIKKIVADVKRENRKLRKLSQWNPELMNLVINI